MIRIAGGSLRGRLLHIPRGRSVRPTAAKVREAVADILQAELPGADFLDAFAGSGAMGIEALSRGARTATFIEDDRLALAALRRNIAELSIEGRSDVLAMPFRGAARKLVRSGRQFDIAFVDPPYRTGPEAIVEALIRARLIRSGSVLAIETEARRAFEPPIGVEARRHGYGDTAVWILRLG